MLCFVAFDCDIIFPVFLMHSLLYNIALLSNDIMFYVTVLLPILVLLLDIIITYVDCVYLLFLNLMKKYGVSYKRWFVLIKYLTFQIHLLINLILPSHFKNG